MKIYLLLIVLFVNVLSFSTEIKVLSGLEKPDSLTLYKDKMYITDQARIRIYSIPDGKLIQEIGRAGEGPGEFKVSGIDRIGLRIVVNEKGIMVNSIGKLSLFALDGLLVEEKKVVLNSATQLFKPVGNKYIGFYRGIENGDTYYFVDFYDSDSLNKINEFHRVKAFIQGNSIDPLRLALLLKNASLRGPVYNVYKNAVFIEGDENRIYKYNLEGKLLCSFSPLDIEKSEIKRDFKEKVMAYLEKRLPTAFKGVKQKGKFHTYLPLRFFQVANELVYVQTFKSEKGKSEFYIYDLDGTFERKIMVPFVESEFLVAYPFAIDNGKIYQIVENEHTEDWELNINLIN